MRTHNLTKTFNTILIASAFLFLYLSIKNLFIDKNNLAFNLKNLIGNIGSYENDVRLKRPDSLSWNQVKQNKIKLIPNDSVFTNTNSEVLLELIGGQNLKLKSESLVKLKTQDQINLQSGDIEVNLQPNSEPLYINLGNKKYKLEAQEETKVSIKKNIKNHSLKVTAGSLQLTSNKQSKTINRGQETLLKNDELSFTSKKINLVSPKGKVFIKGDQKIKFDFRSNLSASSITVVSESGNQIQISPKEKATFLKPGLYTWYLTIPNTDSSLIKESFEIIKEVSSPKIISPIHNLEIQTYSLPVDINFKWKSSFDTLLQVGENEILTKSSGGHTLSLSDAGKYSWKIKVAEDYRVSNFSKVNSFFIKYNDLSKSKAVTIELTKPNQLVEFNWKTQNKVRVQFVLSKDPDFKNIVYQEQTRGTSVKTFVKDIGVYYWQVKSANGVTPVKVLIRPTPAPQRGPKVKNIIKKIKTKKQTSFMNFIIPNAHAEFLEKVNINWEEIVDAKSYEIQFFDNPKSKQPKQTLKTTKPYIQWSAPAHGTYYYRVRYIDHWNRKSPFSKMAQIDLVISEVKKPKKRKKTISKTTNKKIEKNKFNYRVNLLYSYQSLDYSQSSGQKYVVEGHSTTGHGIEFLSTKKYRGLSPRLSYYSQYGKVFNEQNYSQRQFKTELIKAYKLLNIGISMAAFETSLYKNQGEFSKNKTTISPGLSLELPRNIGDHHNINFFLTYNAGSATQTSYGVSYQYHSIKRYSPILKILKNSLKQKINNGEIESDYFQILTGLQYQF